MIITSSKNKIKTSLDKYSVFNLNKDNGEVAVKNEPIHFVQMYDRSGSMYGDLEKLTINIKDFCDIQLGAQKENISKLYGNFLNGFKVQFLYTGRITVHPRPKQF